MERKITLCIALLFIGASLLPLISGAEITQLKADENLQIYLTKSEEITTITYHIPSFNTKEINVDGTTYNKIILGKESNSLITGHPDLPNIRRSILFFSYVFF